jgi:hypothetical protein
MSALALLQGMAASAVPVVPVTLSTTDTAANLTRSNGDLTLTRDAAAAPAWRIDRVTLSKNSGKRWAEWSPTVYGGNGGQMLGLIGGSDTLTNYTGSTTPSAGYALDESPTTHVYYNGGTTVGGGPQGDVVGDHYMMCMFWTGGTVRIWCKALSVAGWIGGGDPAANTSPTCIITATDMFLAVGLNFSGDAGTLNVGGSTPSNTVPTGFIGYQD